MIGEYFSNLIIYVILLIRTSSKPAAGFSVWESAGVVARVSQTKRIDSTRKHNIMMDFEVHMVRLSQQSFNNFTRYIFTLRHQLIVVVDWVRPHPQSDLAPCRQRSRNQSLQRSMLSCSLKAGNLIMDAVIYSSHGSYLAPADLMEGKRGGGMG